jgi:phage protein D
MPPPVIYVSLPRFTLDGQDQPGLRDNLLSLLTEETTEGLFRCEARFNNIGLQDTRADYLYFGRDILDFGKDFIVQMGPPDQALPVFKGRITGLEAEYPYQGASELLVLAEDKLQALRMTRRTRTFEDMSDDDVITQIANEHSLTPHLTLSGPTHKVLAQVNQSDLAFIRDRARSLNAEVWVDDTDLYVMARTDRTGDTVDLEYRLNLQSFSVRADLAHQCTEVGVAGWDVAAKDGIEETAESSTISAELGSDAGGGAILQEAFGERKERVVHTVPLTSDEARNLAQARYRERARRFLTGAGIADGDPKLRAGTTVNLTGLGPLFNGKYYLARVRHTYDAVYGYRTEFDAERPGLGQG